jgi:hypothetical protein
MASCDFNPCRANPTVNADPGGLTGLLILGKDKLYRTTPHLLNSKLTKVRVFL